MKKNILLTILIIGLCIPHVQAKQEESGSNGVPFQALWDALDAVDAAISDLRTRVSALEATHSLSEVWNAIWGIDSEVEALQNEVNTLKEEIMEPKKYHPLIIGNIVIRPSDAIMIPSGTP